MRAAVIALVICVCMCLSAADVARLKATKARLAARIAGKVRHHKRGVLSPIPPYKLGHDIPLVTHSVVKPLVVTYPPTASVTAVKVPLTHPFIHRHPVSVGHKVNHPHSHFGSKYPHTNTVLVPKPDHHFHHHHHHVEPKPVLPVLPAPPAPATPVVPIPQPTGTVAHPIPAPSPPVVLHPSPILPPQPVPIAPPPLHVLPSNHIDVKPILPAATVPLHPAAAVPFQPAPIPLPQAPHVPAPIPLAPQYPYIIRPGNAVQTSFFATYPRYPLLNYHSPLLPLAPPIAPASINQVVLQRPHVPSFHLVPQAAGGEGVLEQPVPTVPVEPTLIHPTQPVPQPTVHLQPTQPAVSIDSNGWSPVPSQAHDLTPVQHTEAHFPQPEHHFTQEQATQVFEHHTGNEQQYHDYQHQLQHHIQQQLEQSQYEHNLNHQHQLPQEYGAPQQLSHEYGQPNQEYPQHAQDFSQHNQDFSQHNQDYAQHGQDYAQHTQDYAQHAQDYAQHAQDYAQQAQDYAHAQHAQEYAQHAQEYAQHDYSQQGQEHAGNDFNLAHQQLGQEYGLPQAEGRSVDNEGESEAQRYHNHIPLGLQPPINRPPEQFR
ncbi:RNA-binding protein 33-like [Galleria mellonella]|uniref:RNA-binding protein 33-like n=1 Tax=Galleria mellonella TaxID=7137 RepID=A0A6J1WAD9_GALME|nr:RNA-binding protein 33-like [Galleria mellonella]